MAQLAYKSLQFWRRGGLHRHEARVRPVLQSLVCREVPQGGWLRGPMHRPLQALPAVCSESDKGEGDSY